MSVDRNLQAETFLKNYLKHTSYHIILAKEASGEEFESFCDAFNVDCKATKAERSRCVRK